MKVLINLSAALGVEVAELIHPDTPQQVKSREEYFSIIIQDKKSGN